MAQVHHILTEVPRFHGFLKIRLLAITCGQPQSGSQLLRLRLAQKATRLPTRSLFLSAFYQHSISIPSASHQRPISGPVLLAVRLYQRSKTKKASDTLAGLLGVVPWRRGTLAECPDAQS
ncbi:MAG: hypothetical protein ACOYKN_17190 [Pirellula sp.]